METTSFSKWDSHRTYRSKHQTRWWAHNTPFTSSWLRQIFRHTSLDDFVQKIKEQSSLLQDLHPLTKYFLNQMVTSQKPTSVATYLSIYSLQKEFCKWKESTTTLPWQLHPGHWKKICIDYMEDKGSLKEQELKKMQADILEAHLNLISYALKWSYSYNW